MQPPQLKTEFRLKSTEMTYILNETKGKKKLNLLLKLITYNKSHR